jgi:hypothetical protein
VWTICVASHPNYHLHCPSKWIACIFQLANEALQLQQKVELLKKLLQHPTPSIIFMSFGLMSNYGDQSFTHEELLQDYIAPRVGWDPNQGIVDNLIQMVIGCNLTSFDVDIRTTKSINIKF